jgi:large subunit ribosomal protein L25
MNNNFTIDCSKRLLLGTNKIKKIRQDGYIPSVIYFSKKSSPLEISVNSTQFMQFLMKKTPGGSILFIRTDCKNSVVSLKMDNGETLKCLISDIDVNSVTREVLHIQFLEFTDLDYVVLDIPVKLINRESCVGLKRGGKLGIVPFSVKLKVNTKHIPSNLAIDILNLEIGKEIKLSEIPLPNGCEMIKDITVAKVKGRIV